MAVVFGVVCLVFFLLHLVPGDPVEVMLGESARPADRAALQQALGLDLPLHVQFVHYLANLSQFDLGTSFYSKRPIRDLLLERLPATVELGVAALLVALLLAVPLGILAAVKKRPRGTSVRPGLPCSVSPFPISGWGPC